MLRNSPKDAIKRQEQDADAHFRVQWPGITICIVCFEAFKLGKNKRIKISYINVIKTYLREMEDVAYCSYLEMELV
jgi:hypothetical protein